MSGITQNEEQRMELAPNQSFLVLFHSARMAVLFGPFVRVH
jgi:hypothetical protein